MAVKNISANFNNTSSAEGGEVFLKGDKTEEFAVVHFVLRACNKGKQQTRKQFPFRKRAREEFLAGLMDKIAVVRQVKGE